MLGAIAGLIGAGVSAWSAFNSSKQQENANKANRQEADYNRQFQERMARNKHQYEVEDLKKAGLNPILSANSGSGVPGGAMARIESSAKDVAQNLSLAKMGTEIALTKALAKKTTAEASSANSRAVLDRVNAQIGASPEGIYDAYAKKGVGILLHNLMKAKSSSARMFKGVKQNVNNILNMRQTLPDLRR